MRSASTLCRSRIRNLSVRRGKVDIIKDINAEFNSGELTAIIGPNGAGKTTLLKAILGEIDYIGNIEFISSKGQINKKPLIGYVPQHLNFDKSTPMSVADFFAASISRRPVWLGYNKATIDKTREALNKVNMAYAMTRKIGDLSGGELQRVMLAMALNPLPSILILDEPVSGIDQAGREIFYKSIASLKEEYDMAILLVSHDLNMLSKYADKVILLKKYILCKGSAEYVFAHEETKELMGNLR